MTMSRITITLDDDVLAAVRERVPPGEVSAFVVEAVRRRLRTDPIDELLERLGEWHGPLTDEEKAEGERWARETMEELFSTLEQSSDWPEETGA